MLQTDSIAQISADEYTQYTRIVEKRNYKQSVEWKRPAGRWSRASGERAAFSHAAAAVCGHSVIHEDLDTQWENRMEWAGASGAGRGHQTRTRAQGPLNMPFRRVGRLYNIHVTQIRECSFVGKLEDVLAGQIRSASTNLENERLFSAGWTPSAPSCGLYTDDVPARCAWGGPRGSQRARSSSSRS